MLSYISRTSIILTRIMSAIQRVKKMIQCYCLASFSYLLKEHRAFTLRDLVVVEGREVKGLGGCTFIIQYQLNNYVQEYKMI